MLNNSSRGSKILTTILSVTVAYKGIYCLLIFQFSLVYSLNILYIYE